jgi:hypothetical protein
MENPMNRRLIVHTTDGESREDGSVYYASYFLVESPILTFSESLFQSEFETISRTEIIDALTNIDYTVTDLDVTILIDE